MNGVLRRLLFIGFAVLMTLPCMPATHAAATVHAHVTFRGGTITDNAGNTWSTSGTVSYASDKITIEDGEYIEASLPGFTSSLQSNEDWYVRTKLTIDSGWFVIMMDKYGGSGYDLRATYNRGTSTWTLVLNGQAYTFTDSLAAATSYDIVFTRDGGDLFYYRDAELRGSAPLTGPTVGQAAAPFQIGSKSGGDIHLTIESLQIVGGKAFRMVDAEEVSVSVVGTDISLSLPTLTFASVVLDHAATTTTTRSGTVSVSDERGTGEGWSLKVKSTDLLTDSITDPTSGGSGQFVLSIPASAISVSAPTITSTGGQAVHAAYGPLGSAVTLSNIPQPIVETYAGFGMGDYDIAMDFTVTVPKVVQIASMSGTGSTYTTGQTIGILSATYKGTITFAIGTGL